MAGRGERGVSRVLDKLEASVNSGQYYEAHQMYRTLYFRYLSLNKYPDLLDLLYNGATLLLHRDQQGSGADLAVLLIDVLNKSETKPCPEWIEKIATIFQIMSPSIPEREAFLTVSVKWSMDNNRKGHPLLHKRIAEIFWKEKKFSAAHRHFLHSNDGSTYADMLIELHTTQGLKSEIDLFIAQAVLQCLCLRNLQMATEAFNKYTGTHPTIKNDKGPPFLLPLLNFLWFLMKAIEQKHVIQFKILRTCYAITIKRDPNYSVYLDTIGRLWFGIEIPQGNKNSNSILGGLLNSLIGNIDTSEDEGDGTEPRSTATPDLD